MSDKHKEVLLLDDPPVTSMQVWFRLQLSPEGEVHRVQIRKKSTARVDVDIMLTKEQALSLANMINAKFGGKP